MVKNSLKTVVIGILILFSFTSIGCGVNEGLEVDLQSLSFTTMETSPITEYEIPEQSPSIFINTVGYTQNSEKKVYVVGKILPETFQVVEVSSGMVVLTQELIASSYDPKEQLYYAYGSFSMLTQEGEYYIKSEHLGYSYPFTISDSVYQYEFDSVFAQIYEQNKMSQNTIDELCDSIAVLLLTYEMYGDTYEDGSFFAKNDIPETLDLIGQLVDQLILQQDSTNGSVQNITEKYAGIVAWFGFIYKEYDTVRATEYLKLADLAWQYAIDHKIADKDMELLFAAAQLFRATGIYSYHKEYKNIVSGLEYTNIVNDPYGFYGGFTYSITQKSTDAQWCASFIAALMKEVELVVDDEHLWENQIRPLEDSVALYEKFQLLLVANYINLSLEYEQSIMNRFDYIAGCNIEGSQIELSNKMLQYSYWYMILDQVK